MTRQVTLKYGVGDTVYVPQRNPRRSCEGPRLEPFQVEAVRRVRDENSYLVDGEWVEESFLVSQSDYQATASDIVAEERDCFQRKLDKLG